MALYLGSDNTSRYLKTAEKVSWAGSGSRPFTHLVRMKRVDGIDDQSLWSFGENAADKSLNMILKGYSSSGRIVTTTQGNSPSPRITTTAENSYEQDVLFSITFNPPQNANNSYGYVASITYVDLLEEKWICVNKENRGNTSGPNTLASDYLLIGAQTGRTGSFCLSGTLYYAGSLNRPLTNDELIAIASGQSLILDEYRQSLVEFWDFQRNSDDCLVGIVDGTLLVKEGDGWSWTEEAIIPISSTHHNSINLYNSSLNYPPEWISTLDYAKGASGIIEEFSGGSVGSSSVNGVAGSYAYQESSSKGTSHSSAELSAHASTVGLSEGRSDAEAIGDYSYAITREALGNAEGYSSANGLVSRNYSSEGESEGYSLAEGYASSTGVFAYVSAGSSDVLGYMESKDAIPMLGVSSGFADVLGRLSADCFFVGESTGKCDVVAYAGDSGPVLGMVGASSSYSSSFGLVGAGVQLSGSAYGSSVVSGLTDSETSTGPDPGSRFTIGYAYGSSGASGVIVPTQTALFEGAAHGTSTTTGLFSVNDGTGYMSGEIIMVSRQTISIEVTL